MKIMFKYLSSLLVVLTISGCSTIYSRTTYQFETLESPFNIYYETGSEDIAKEIDGFVGDLLSEIEKAQYIKFKSPEDIKIYVFSEAERYSNYSMASIKTRGSATTNEIYISPIIRDRLGTLRSIVAHELSHIHIRQYVGTWDYINDIPEWFHEGLAVTVSGDGGAEKVSKLEASKYLSEGKHFIPRTKGGLLKHKTAHDYGLKPQMYYRQSSMFIRYLIHLDPNAFKRCYTALAEGDSFGSVWKLNYSKDLSELWVGFMSEIQA